MRVLMGVVVVVSLCECVYSAVHVCVVASDYECDKCAACCESVCKELIS